MDESDLQAILQVHERYLKSVEELNKYLRDCEESQERLRATGAIPKISAQKTVEEVVTPSVRPVDEDQRRRKKARAPSTSSTSYKSPDLALKPFQCVICLENMLSRNPHSTLCGHFFCFECIKSAITIKKKCPICRKPMIIRWIHPIYP
ncbi:hypothetical protein DMENIID0001_149440 [Sergentomyia squamirostris]